MVTPLGPTTTPSAAAGTASAQALADPPRPAGPDGWTPATVTAVRSMNKDGFITSALNFTLESVTEQPGQRLSTQMVDEIAPHLAASFGIDEQFVRGELAKVYLYVGGPAVSTKAAMTIGHHIFLPNDEDLGKIVSPGYKRWLVHELAHTMQFLKYENANKYSFLGSYIKSMVVGRDPQSPGSGGGPLVWGAAFTGWQTQEDGHETIGVPAATADQRLGFSVQPALAIGLPLAAVTSGGLIAARSFARSRALPEMLRSVNILGNANPLLTGGALVAAPLLLGSLSGVFADELGSTPSRWLGAAAGAGVAGATLLAAGAFKGIGNGRYLLGATGGNLLGVGAIAVAGALGLAAASISANTISGWSKNAQILHEHPSRIANPSLMDSIHDSHWQEIDAETVALEFGDTPATEIDTSAFDGVLPETRGSFGDQLDWGLWNPLILGVPAAVVGGGAVLGARTLHTFLGDTVVREQGLLKAFGHSFANLQSKHRGLVNSMGVAGAVTLAPMLVGGIGAQIADRLVGPDMAKVAGTAAASLTAGAMLTVLLKGNGASLLSLTPKVLAGMGIAAGVGMLSSSIAVNALHPGERSYDTSGGKHAQ